jgi:hypothetical protein
MKTVRSLVIHFDKIAKQYCVRATYSDCSVEYFDHGTLNYVKIQLKFHQQAADSMNKLVEQYTEQ